jgi:hypothetical protein
VVARTTITRMKKKERQRKGKSAQEIIIIIIETIEVEATSAVLVATKERENAFLQFSSRCVCNKNDYMSSN